MCLNSLQKSRVIDWSLLVTILMQLAHRKFHQNRKASFARLWSETALFHNAVLWNNRNKSTSVYLAVFCLAKSRQVECLQHWNCCWSHQELAAKQRKGRTNSLALLSRMWHLKSYRCFLQVMERVWIAGTDDFRQQCWPDLLFSGFIELTLAGR